MGSLYLHIPFCERKCVYCDFYSIESQTPLAPFLSALEVELREGARRQSWDSVSTIFFGGGTPSLLTEEQLHAILVLLHQLWPVAPDAEVTLETNPGTVDRDKLRSFRAAGINRLSIGIQSFREEELRFLGRIHDRAQAVRCVEDARAAGFGNVSMDLIYSLPGQTEDAWADTLRQGLALRPDHVSAYSLIVEDHTPLHRMVKEGKVVPNPAESEARLYEFTMDFLAAAGYDHYEVSSYARPGFACRHNLAYWHHEEYLGFGPSAHSFLHTEDGQAIRRANVADIGSYLQSLGRGAMPIAFEERLSARELAEERLFLGLRSDGVALGPGPNHEDVPPGPSPIVLELLERGLARPTSGGVRLTDKGYLLCDEIAVRLMER